MRPCRSTKRFRWSTTRRWRKSSARSCGSGAGRHNRGIPGGSRTFMAVEGDTPPGARRSTDRTGPAIWVWSCCWPRCWSVRRSVCGTGSARAQPLVLGPLRHGGRPSSSQRPSGSSSSPGREPGTTSRSSSPTRRARGSPSSTTRAGSSTPTSPMWRWRAAVRRRAHGGAAVHRRAGSVGSHLPAGAGGARAALRAEEIRLSPSLSGHQEFGWYRVRAAPAASRGGTRRSGSSPT